MKKALILLSLIFCSSVSFAQITATSVPDSTKNVTLPGTGPQPAWNITNPLNHNGTSFANTPINVAINSHTDYLYLNDFGFNIPTGSIIDGIKAVWNRGGCNNGAVYYDTLHLAYNGAIVSDEKTGAEPGTMIADSAGGSLDLWGATLNEAIINDNSFGIFYNMADSGICTFGVFNMEITVYYSNANGVSRSTTTLIDVYPNPAEDFVMVRLPENFSSYDWRLLDVLGKEIKTGAERSNNFEIPLENFNPGVYFLEVNSLERMMKKIVVN